MTTEESREVAEARANLIWNYTEDGWEVPVMNRDIDLLVDAVRKDERRRLGVEEVWERGVI